MKNVLKVDKTKINGKSITSKKIKWSEPESRFIFDPDSFKNEKKKKNNSKYLKSWHFL